jgi:hypothetical protein
MHFLLLAAFCFFAFQMQENVQFFSENEFNFGSIPKAGLFYKLPIYVSANNIHTILLLSYFKILPEAKTKKM